MRTVKNKRLKTAARIVCSLWLCLYAFASSAQDIHFSQFFTNPVILNPAQTGNFQGNYRLGFNFKAQWPWAIDGRIYNYHTEAPYVDFSFLENKIKQGWMGLGVNFLNDEAGDGRLTYRRIGLSYAYHLAFDKDEKFILSAGVGLWYIIRSVDFEKFYFNNQWVDDDGFNTSLSSGENISGEKFTMIDLSAGLNFNAHVNDHLGLNAGFSMLHVNRPKHSFYNADERLGFRYVANAGAEIQASEKWSVQVNGYYTYEKKASDIMVGALAGFSPSTAHSKLEQKIFLGVYYRIKDALAPMVGYQLNGTRLLVNYDIVLSSLSKASKLNGGPELSIVHVGSWTRRFTRKVYCPKF